MLAYTRGGGGGYDGNIKTSSIMYTISGTIDNICNIFTTAVFMKILVIITSV